MDWGGLKNTHFRIDYLRGSAWSKEHLQPLVKPELLHEVSDGSQALQRLKAYRSDLFIGLEAVIMKLLHTDEFKDAFTIAGVIGENNSYPFVHKSHKDLAPKLAKVLKKMKKMKKDGRFNKIMTQTMPFLSPR